MPTQLGPATIQVTLDVKKANEQLTALERRMKEMGHIEIKEQKAREEQQQKPVEQEKLQQKSRFARNVAVTIGAIAAGAVLFEKVLPAIGEGLESFAKTKNIPFFEEAMKAVNDKLNAISDTVSDLTSKLKVALPTYEQTKDIARARMLLGEPPSVKDVSDTSGILFQVNETMTRAQREREKVTRETLGKLMGELLAGGAGK